ncbi:glycoside hydrolase family protein [Mangrovibacter phragmitis]|uniref:glycoside hydrolase family protein n=1 Tax=Mangrovibacter phragmitis TaxID=1691903 RepID=UPI0035115C4F
MNSIKNSVGKGGTNNYNDVKEIQKLLRENGFPSLNIDGICGPNTIKAILTYQKHFYHYPDGVISPGKKTFQLLTGDKNTRSNSLNKADGATCTNPNGKKSNSRYMNPSINAYNLLKKYEQKINYPYSDKDPKQHKTKLTKWDETATIGYGHLINTPEEFNQYRDGITDQQADSIFKKDSYWILEDVRKYIKVDLTQNEFDAIFILAFNIGPGSPRSHKHKGLYWSSVLAIVNGESNADLYSAWTAYDISRGKESGGLLKRRMSELKVYNEGVYIKL